MQAEEAARKPEAAANGGRSVTPASTIDIAREELDFSEASDQDDFGDFEDAVLETAPAAASAPTLDRCASSSTQPSFHHRWASGLSCA